MSKNNQILLEEIISRLINQSEKPFSREEFVPVTVAEKIKAQQLFGYKPAD